MRLLGFFGVDVKTNRPSKYSCGSESDCDCSIFEDSRLLSSTNLFDRIWVTSFGGTGEKPGGHTNDCCRTGTLGKEGGTVGTSPVEALEGEGATEETGGENVETKDGTKTFGLPGDGTTVPAVDAGTDGKPTPEAAKAEACEFRLDASVVGTPPVAPTMLEEA